MQMPQEANVYLKLKWQALNLDDGVECSSLPIEKSSRNPYGLQAFEGYRDFVMMLTKQQDTSYLPVKTN